MSDAWVWKWFLHGFWERVEVEGLSALGRVQKVLGARVRNYDWVDDGVRKARDARDSGERSSRGRGADGEGVVRVGQPWVESESEDEDEDDEDEDDSD